MGQKKKFNFDVGSTKTQLPWRRDLEQVLSVRDVLFWAKMAVHLYPCLLILPVWTTQGKSQPLVRLLSKAETDHRRAACWRLSDDRTSAAEQSFLEGDLGGTYPCLSYLD